MKRACCRNTYWVCETHDDRPWDGETCGCGGAGMPCPSCNVSTPTTRRGCLPDFSATKPSTTNEPERIGMMIESGG